jgi:mono/diheme cytochrome c family protein
MIANDPRTIKLAVVIGFSSLLFFFVEDPTHANSHPHATDQNPLKATQENLALGLDHFIAHCAECHGSSGKGDTPKGKATRAADLTSEKVQSRTDAELFGVISEGVPGTAMPAFGKSHSATSIWQLVLFLRKLPTLSAAERGALEAAVPANAPHHHAETGPGEHHHDEPGGPPDHEHMEHMEHMDDRGQKAGPPAPGQEPQHDMAKHETSEGQPQDHHAGHDIADMPGMAGHNMTDMTDMMASPAGGPFRTMAAIGSGTSLMPAVSPMSAYHWMKDDWMLMLHFNAFAGVDHQGGPRGVTKAESINWGMFMAEHPVDGGGSILVRGMFSAEPFTSGNGGFPELFQTGETWRGRPIIDAQHPHNLFMELAATLTMPLAEHASVFVYGGPVGEPALGPVAFMHRESASENSSAPLGHHWEDSTHISFGVFTAGVNFWKFRVEGSVFRGEEPNEHRKTIQLGTLDSYSGRIWFTPTPNWAFQFSHGFIHRPEILEPGNVDRTTASIAYTRPWQDGYWATSLIWGRNHEQIGDSNAYLVESTANFLNKDYLYTRLELVDKPGLLEENIFGRAGLDSFPSDSSGFAADRHSEQFFRIGAFTFGGVRDIIAHPKLRIGVGADVTFYHVPDALQGIYGSSPRSFNVFIRFRPGKMSH